MTSEQLWAHAEAAYEARVVELEQDLERRFDARALVELAERAHAANIREQEKALRATNMAVRRMQRAQRMGRRAARLIEAACALHAKVSDAPLVREGDEPMLAEARRRLAKKVWAEIEAGDA